MPKNFYMRTIVAGRYRKVVRYTRSLPGDEPPVRNAKSHATTGAQNYINIKNSTERLQWLLCANFDRKDACFCTFTFSDEHLPLDKAAARKLFRSFQKSRRKQWGAMDKDRRSIYVIEGDPSPTLPNASSLWEVAPWRDKEKWEQIKSLEDEVHNTPVRLHAHCFLLLDRQDYETIRSLWPWGHVYINRIQVNDPSAFQRLAAYVTKEARDGKLKTGERSYTPSLDLEQPQDYGHWCEDFEGITVPQDAQTLNSGSMRNDLYGASMEYVYYRLPRAVQSPKPYQRKGNLSSKKSRRKAE